MPQRPQNASAQNKWIYKPVSEAFLLLQFANIIGIPGVSTRHSLKIMEPVPCSNSGENGSKKFLSVLMSDLVSDFMSNFFVQFYVQFLVRPHVRFFCPIFFCFIPFNVRFFGWFFVQFLVRFDVPFGVRFLVRFFCPISCPILGPISCPIIVRSQVHFFVWFYGRLSGANKVYHGRCAERSVVQGLTSDLLPTLGLTSSLRHKK